MLIDPLQVAQERKPKRGIWKPKRVFRKVASYSETSSEAAKALYMRKVNVVFGNRCSETGETETRGIQKLVVGNFDDGSRKLEKYDMGTGARHAKAAFGNWAVWDWCSETKSKITVLAR